jgi:integrase/recombinase XerC
MIYRTVKKYLAHYTTTEKSSPHVLRHTYATHLLNKGAEINAVKELLGHTSLAATQVYTHNSLDKLKKVFEQAHPKA